MHDTDDYVLGRRIFDSVRLDAQHLLWKLHKGYELDPRIPITDDMKIAELGTGTAIWLYDLAQQLPVTVQLHGFDISDSQYPSKEQVPQNITLGVLDSMKDPPSSLIGQYDVVHFRMWASNFRNGDPGPVIRHAKRLLKPGGYIQWEDADLIHQYVQGLAAKDFEEKVGNLFQKAGLDYNWVSQLSDSLQKEGFNVLEFDSAKFAPSLTQLCTNTFLLALQEILQGIKRRCPPNQHSLALPTHEDALYLLSTEHRDRIVYNWSPVTALAQLPL
ncbi:S-adenosyl-L-methionine-dependent methyltransferase [Aspergillus coremiiformis]|uniref:S-adenosyl-L-methionine-dependent methyltransferase n=1 Tax=Aspergillus coremiiformis TaxID=138285 RepID=A0A5N6Z3T0_9EURO|nr:S-adenosyl-L-methionine-dependent methyltransferase [Aspergillus coremiiformis]